MALIVFLASSISKSSSSFGAAAGETCCLEVSAARIPAPEMMSSVRASSMNQVTSSTDSEMVATLHASGALADHVVGTR